MAAPSFRRSNNAARALGIRMLRASVAVFLLIDQLGSTALPAQAARPLLDQHQWDDDFALFARDSNVPWNPTAVRLETYSSAPVDFSAYAVDPVDVLVAGRPQGRALATAGRKPVVRWRFTPPPGYRVEGNTVDLPLGSREGVFLVQARRKNAVEQVWVNRTRIGLLSKEGPDGLLVYATDLHSGLPLASMRLSFLIGHQLITRSTDAQGIVRWNMQQGRPKFVLAQWGMSWAFLSFLPQAPIPGAVAAVKLDQAVVRSGASLHAVGYVRRRQGDVFHPGSGDVHVALLMGGRTLASTTAHLDAAGAFDVSFIVPHVTGGGSATVLISAPGASAGAGLQIDAASDAELAISTECAQSCSAERPVPILIVAKHHGQPLPSAPVHVSIVRYPHIFPPGAQEQTRESWEAATVYDGIVRTNVKGIARVVLGAPTDLLPSTLGVQARLPGDAASASTRLILPNSAVALTVAPEHDQVDVGQSVGIELHAFQSGDGRPVRGLVSVVMSHGPNAAQQRVQLDARGQGHALFRHPQFGSNLIVATLHSDLGGARDANTVNVEPRALAGDVPHGFHVDIVSDHARYRPGGNLSVQAPAPGASGVALLSLDARRLAQVNVIPVSGNQVRGALKLGNPQGDIRAGVAFVRQSALVFGSTPIAVDGAGHERLTDLVLDAGHYPQGAVAHVAVNDGGSKGLATTVVRLTDTPPSGSADFSGAGDVLSIGGVTTQSSATDDPPWHAWVTPDRSRAVDLFADLARRPAEIEPPMLSDTSARVVYWNVARMGNTLQVPLPHVSGRYVLSVLRMYDDGEVGAASIVVSVS